VNAYFEVQEDEDESFGAKIGWYVWLFDADENGTCHHTEPFATEVEARAAATVTGLPEWSPEERRLASERLASP
jgi:hypothetical protein